MNLPQAGTKKTIHVMHMGERSEKAFFIQKGARLNEV